MYEEKEEKEEVEAGLKRSAVPGSDWQNDYCVSTGNEVDGQGRHTKWFKWDRLGAGHCFMYPGSKLILRDDGSASWAAATQSTDSRDWWDLKFDFFAADGAHLFTFPRQDTGESFFQNYMEDVGVATDWLKEWSYKDKALLSRVSRAKMDYRC